MVTFLLPFQTFPLSQRSAGFPTTSRMPDRRTADQNLDPLWALPEHLSLSTADHEVKVPLSFITFLGEGRFCVPV